MRRLTRSLAVLVPAALLIGAVAPAAAAAASPGTPTPTPSPATRST
ncbi:hypothetical protein [Pseudolysinimonas kribbensis]|nr:hypothetical protein [Pseudolysinimonas kribbensis]